MTQEEFNDRVQTIVRSKRESLAYAAPEMHDLHWRELTEQLCGVWDELTDDDQDDEREEKP